MVCRTARTCTICLNALFILIGISLASTGAYMLHVLGKYDIPGAVSLYFYNNNFYSIYKNIVLTFAIVPNCIQLFSFPILLSLCFFATVALICFLIQSIKPSKI